MSAGALAGGLLRNNVFSDRYALEMASVSGDAAGGFVAALDVNVAG